MMDKLNTEELDACMTDLTEWSVGTDKIQRTYSMEDFAEAMTFVNQIAAHAEDAQHHPDILIRYNKVTLTLSTHDAGGITEKDTDFAAVADSLQPAQQTG